MALVLNTQTPEHGFTHVFVVANLFAGRELIFPTQNFVQRNFCLKGLDVLELREFGLS